MRCCEKKGSFFAGKGGDIGTHKECNLSGVLVKRENENRIRKDDFCFKYVTVYI